MQRLRVNREVCRSGLDDGDGCELESGSFGLGVQPGFDEHVRFGIEHCHYPWSDLPRDDFDVAETSGLALYRNSLSVRQIESVDVFLRHQDAVPVWNSPVDIMFLVDDCVELPLRSNRHHQQLVRLQLRKLSYVHYSLT